MSIQPMCGSGWAGVPGRVSYALIVGLVLAWVPKDAVLSQPTQAPAKEETGQSAEDGEPASEEEKARQGAAVIDSIIVTATKREESAQSVPITIQAFEGSELQDRGVEQATDVVKLAPNMNISTMNEANQQINIRGVGTVDFFGNATGSVGLYMDEVTMSSPYLSGLGLYDLERVEVLRGPQNSLFGRNTTGGAVNYLSRRAIVGGPADGSLRFTLGRFGRTELEGGYTFQLGEKAAARLAGKVYHRDGIWNNLATGDSDYGEKNRFSGRATVVMEPSANTALTFNSHYARDDSEIDPYRFVGLRSHNGSPEFFTRQPGPVPSGPPLDTELDFTGNSGGVNAQGAVVDTENWNDVVRVGNDNFDIETFGLSIKVDRELAWGTFTSITSYDHSEVGFTLDLGGPGLSPDDITMLNAQDQEFDQFSQELRWTSSQEGRFRWIAGLYSFYEESLLGQNIGFGPFGFDTSQPLTVPGGPPIPGQPVGGSFGFWALIAGGAPANANGYGNQAGFSIAELENLVVSSYLHADYDLGKDLTLNLGLRVAHDEKRAPSLLLGNVSTAGLPRDQFRGNDTILQLASGLPACDFDGDGNPTGGTADNRGLPCTQTLTPEDLDFDEIGGKLGLSWQATQDVLLYGHYSRGFRSGKFDIEFFHGPQTGFARNDQDVETLDAFELGVKSQLGGSFQLNAAGFYSLWEDQQLFDVDPLTGPIFLNVAKSRLWGSEVEIKWAPTTRFFLQLGAGALDSEVTDEGPDPFNLVEEGHELPFVTDFSANALVSYDVPFGSLGVLTLQSGMRYQGESATKLRDVIFINQYSNLTEVNARMAFKFFRQERFWEVALVGENLTGEEHCGFELDLFALAGGAYCLPTDGEETWGIQVGINF